ncbi:hypothetical protein D3C85_1665450 [compost metagenome]
MQGSSALATQTDTGSQPTQVTTDQHDVSRRQRDVCTARPHGHTNHTRLEGQGVVDAITYHHRPEAGIDFRKDAVEFVFGQRLRFDVTDADILGQAMGDTVSITGQQQLPAQP